MSQTSSFTWAGIARDLPRRGLYVIVVAVALFGFVALTHGKGLGVNGTAMAYGEAVHYSIAPTALGRIDSVLVRLGQKVRAGDPVAVMDGRDLLAAKARAVAQLAQLEAAVAASEQDQELQVTRSELWVLKARAEEHGNRAELAEITDRMDRLNTLLQAQMIPAAPVEEAREKLRELQARVETFDQAKKRGQAGLDQTSAGNHDHDRAVDLHVEPARRAVDVQKAAIEQLDLQIEQLTLRTPVDGTVSTILHHSGEVIDAATEVLAVVSMRPDTIIAEFPEGVAGHVHVGQNVTVRPKNLFSRAITGKVIELSPEVDEMTPRARPSPSISAWGRRATIQLETGSDILPGQAFSVAVD